MNIQFNLSSPLPYLNTKIEKGNFIVQYPSGWSYWQLVDDKGTKALEGNYTFSQEVLAQWTDNDDVLINDLLAAEPWIVKAVEPKNEIVEESLSIEETK